MKEGDCRGEVNQIRLISTYEEWDFMKNKTLSLIRYITLGDSRKTSIGILMRKMRKRNCGNPINYIHRWKI